MVFDREILCGLKSFTGLTETGLDGLLKSTQAFYDVVAYTYRLVQTLTPLIITSSGVIAQPCERLIAACTVRRITSNLCPDDPLCVMPEVVIRVQLCRICFSMTKKRHAAKRNKKLLKVRARA